MKLRPHLPQVRRRDQLVLEQQVAVHPALQRVLRAAVVAGVAARELGAALLQRLLGSGMKLRPHLPQVLRCFNESASLARWDECLEYKVHANVHAWMGGAWDCAVDFTALHTANTTLYPTKARARSLDARPRRGEGAQAPRTCICVSRSLSLCFPRGARLPRRVRGRRLGPHGEDGRGRGVVRVGALRRRRGLPLHVRGRHRRPRRRAVLPGDENAPSLRGTFPRRLPHAFDQSTSVNDVLGWLHATYQARERARVQHDGYLRPSLSLDRDDDDDDDASRPVLDAALPRLSSLATRHSTRSSCSARSAARPARSRTGGRTSRRRGRRSSTASSTASRARPARSARPAARRARTTPCSGSCTASSRRCSRRCARRPRSRRRTT